MPDPIERLRDAVERAEVLTAKLPREVRAAQVVIMPLRDAREALDAVRELQREAEREKK